jgi:hypothetical protein
MQASYHVECLTNYIVVYHAMNFLAYTMKDMLRTECVCMRQLSINIRIIIYDITENR